MYEARQNKDKVSRTISMGSHWSVQLHKIGNNGKHTTFNKRDVVQCSLWDSISGGSSIAGGLISIITGGRDYFNAINDLNNKTYSIENSSLSIRNATGTLEEIDTNNYKVKVKGYIEPYQIPNYGTSQDMSGAMSRSYEGLFNGLSGMLNLGAGAASIVGGVVPATIMYGAGALSSGVAAFIRLFRSISSKKQEASHD